MSYIFFIYIANGKDYSVHNAVGNCGLRQSLGKNLYSSYLVPSTQ